MLMADAFRPGPWNGFFILTGTGAATLTVLVFGALNPETTQQ
jgi:hypothetical protein